ncbi:hypothetical protein RDI58_000943 [Solanum bulbocastanum]|uniref:Uncharacterized protein n=1 Tax=Solanum bulbocastanum TaxID=147425 RepID=A0AAN8YPL7_SOLBU
MYVQNKAVIQKTSSPIHTLILSKEMRNLKNEKSWRLIGRTRIKGNEANKIPETYKCNTQIERMETPVHNTHSTKNKEITTSQLIKNGKLRRGKLTG